jgi:hypothetical protein
MDNEITTPFPELDAAEDFGTGKPIATESEIRMIGRYRIPGRIIRLTECFLREAGRRDCEGVVLWTGTRSGHLQYVTDVIFPRQSAGRYYFSVSLDERIRIVVSLKPDKLVLAQVHSHPRAAFHSAVDDERALLDRQWALSLVVPDFCREPLSGFGTAAGFALRGPLDWVELTSEQLRRVLTEV